MNRGGRGGGEGTRGRGMRKREGEGESNLMPKQVAPEQCTMIWSGREAGGGVQMTRKKFGGIL